MFNVKVFFVSIVVFLVTDFIWLAFIAKGIYFEQYGAWLRIVDGSLQPVWWAAAMVYILFALSLIFLIFPMADGSLLRAAGYGALLGCVVYGVYDFTLLAIMKDWPVKAGFIDWAWGTFLYAFSSAATLFICTRL